MTPWCHHRCLSGWHLLSLSTQCNLCWHQIIWEAPCCPLITPQPSRTPTQARPLGEVCRRGGFLTTPNPNPAEELQYKQQQKVQMEDGRDEGGLLLGPVRQGEAGLDGSGGVGLRSAHSTPKKRWCKRCKTPIGNLTPPCCQLSLWCCRQVSPYSSILTSIIAATHTWFSTTNQHRLSYVTTLMFDEELRLMGPPGS